MTLSSETIDICLALLSQVTLTPSADGFLDTARKLDTARRELEAAREEADS